MIKAFNALRIGLPRAGLLVLLILGSGMAQAQDKVALSPRFAERLLSDHYESIARESLKDVLPSDKYKLLIDVRLDNPAELEKIASDRLYSPLPGTIGNNPEFSRSLLVGELESLTQKRNVLIILDPEYESSLGKESNFKALIEETLTGKLKLNLAGGIDGFNIRNLEISGDTPNRQPASEIEAQKQTSSGLDVLWWLLASLVAIGVYFFVRHRLRQDEKPEPEIATSAVAQGIDAQNEENKEVEEELGEEEKAEKEDGALTPPPAYNVAKSDGPVSPSLLILPTSSNATELTDKIRFLVQQYPKLTSEALQNFLDIHSDKTYRVGYLVELLGFEESLMLFKGVSQKHWRIIGHYMATYPVSNVNPIDLEEAAMLYRYIVARIVEHKGLESDMGIFAIEGYSTNDLSKAIEGESDQFIAEFISGISDAMAQDILNSLSTARRANVFTILSSIEKLDPENINFIETTIQQRLTEEGVKPVTISNEARIFTSLANLPAHEEESLFAQMAQSDPGIVFRSKRHRLYTEHLEFIRQDILAEELRSYPIESLAQMLKGMVANSQNHVLECLSEKKSLVVKDMLNTLESQPNGPEFSEARRSFLDQLYEKYAQGGGAFIDNIFTTAGGHDSAAA